MLNHFSAVLSRVWRYCAAAQRDKFSEDSFPVYQPQFFLRKTRASSVRSELILQLMLNSFLILENILESSLDWLVDPTIRWAVLFLWHNLEKWNLRIKMCWNVDISKGRNSLTVNSKMLCKYYAKWLVFLDKHCFVFKIATMMSKINQLTKLNR